jgi:anti-sigma-K factor RskA
MSPVSPLNHDELRELASAYVLGALDREEREQFETHLADCEVCQAEVRSFQPVVDALAFSVPDRQPSADLRARVLASGPSRPVGKRSRAATVLPWFLATAAAIALAALTPYTMQLRQRTRDLMATVRDLSARLADGDRQLVAVRREVSLLSAPDVRRVDLRGQPAAPRAGARAYFSRTRGVYFVAADLPSVAADKAYELWYVPPAGQGNPVRAFVFTPDQNGGAAFIAQVPAEMPDPGARAVTLEPAGGVPAPTGAFYLLGAVN